MPKTLITEAALAILATSGFQVAQSLYSGGFENLNTVAAGTFAAGVVALVQRYRCKRDLRLVKITHESLDGVKSYKTIEMNVVEYLEFMKQAKEIEECKND